MEMMAPPIMDIVNSECKLAQAITTLSDFEHKH